MIPLTDRRVLIAGASGGVGRATAVAAAAAGAHVLLLGRDTAALEGLREDIERDGGRADVTTADATRADEVDVAVRGLAAAAGVSTRSSTASASTCPRAASTSSRRRAGGRCWT